MTNRSMSDAPQLPGKRSVVRSFVRREGRLTPGQQRAIDEGMPRWGIEPGFATIDVASLFQRSASVVCEIGFGNGDTLFELASRSPETNFIGIEVYRPGVGNLMRQLLDNEMTNVRVSTDDAVELLTHRFPSATLDACHIFFPDPWPKKRHHKRRLIQHPFIDVVARVLKPGGRLHVATDWAPYAEHILQTLTERSEFSNTATQGTYVDRPESRPVTKFEKRGIKLGHGVFDLVFVMDKGT